MKYDNEGQINRLNSNEEVHNFIDKKFELQSLNIKNIEYSKKFVKRKSSLKTENKDLKFQNEQSRV